MKPVVLVTGGSRGIGAATAWLAAQQGWAVAVNYTQDAAAAQTVVARIQAAGGLALAVQADVGNEAQVLAMFAQIDQALPAWGGRWAGLVNSAGVVDQAQRVEAMSVQRLERMMRTNVIGSMVCAREAIPRMSTQHAGQGGAQPRHHSRCVARRICRRLRRGAGRKLAAGAARGRPAEAQARQQGAALALLHLAADAAWDRRPVALHRGKPRLAAARPVAPQP